MSVSEVIKKCEELAVVLDKAIKSEDDRAQKNAEIEKLNEGAAQVNADRAKELDAREQAIKPIEDVVRLKEEAVALAKSAEAQIKEANRIKDETQQFVATEKEAIAKVKAEIKAEQLNLDDDKKLLKREWDELKVAKENYRNEIMRELLSKSTGR